MTLSTEDATVAAVEAFNDAFGRQDVDGVMQAMTPDCVFESTAPPDGTRFEGAEQVRQAWLGFFASAPDATFETEERMVVGDRAVVLWTYRWGGSGEAAGHVRGVDVFRVRDGKVAEKRSYVKG